MPDHELLTLTDCGLYCAPGDFYVDPWRPVDRAVITHAHSDHARPGSRRYLTSTDGRRVLQTRLDEWAVVQTAAYGERLRVNGVTLSLHPAGHILGSAQVRIEHDGEIWCVSGDYKVDPDATCEPFGPVKCHTFVTESTFGLPIYRWPPQESVFADINNWWAACQEEGRPAAIFAYSLGKAQRVLSGLDAARGPILCHGAVQRCNRDYLASGIALPDTKFAATTRGDDSWRQAIIVGPPSAHGSPWLHKFRDVSTAFASGWMTVRGMRRRRGVDRGFVLSDHADWPGLLGAVEATGASRVFVTHGASVPLVRWLRGQGLDAHALKTWFGTESDEEGLDRASEDEPSEDNAAEAEA